MARKPEPDPRRAQFAALLAKHLADGTRPATAAGEPWSFAAFAAEVQSPREENDFVSPRSVSNWCKGASLPEEIEPILRALFGPSDRHAQAKDALRASFLAARAEKRAAIIKKAKPDPAGAMWVARDDDHFELDRTARPTDRRAAKDPVLRQLQTASCTLAAELAAASARLANSRSWGALSATASKYQSVVDCDALEMPNRLGDAYALMLRLGQFLDTDIRIQRDPSAFDNSLDPDIHGLLTNLVRTAAPWLRGFPTVAALDDAAGKALVRADLFQPAREFTRIAREQQAISARDAAELETLADAARADDFLGQKAGNRLVGSATNLILAAAGTMAAFLSGAVAPDFAIRSPLVQRAGAALAAGEAKIEAFAANWSEDIRQALRALVKEGRKLAKSHPGIIPKSPAPPIPDYVEIRAREMILAGLPPPASWRPFIHNLNLVDTPLTKLELLACLNDLQSLELCDTQVSDLSPLAGLSTLQTLNLMRTKVTDLSPLRGLINLKSLVLTGTKVTILSPLASLPTLQTLSLIGTLVNDLSVLADLTSLRSLDLSHSHVRDLSPLAKLTGLQSLDLLDTLVSDVSPLAELTALQSLCLRGTRVIDLTPLAGLVALSTLLLSSTPVNNLAPLVGLTALQTLYLINTKVSDMSRLASLKTLQYLFLNNTWVSDVIPLAGLIALQSLGLRGTQVRDVSPLAGLTALRQLDLEETRVTDISPLAHIRGLEVLR